MELNLLDRMLSAYRSNQTPVTITLQNKVNISGRIKAFDSYVVILENQKHEVVYRHAISCLAPYAHREEQKQPALQKPAQAKPSPRPAQYPPRNPQKSKSARPAPRAAASAPGSESGINNTMKEGLLKWMQEQKAAK